MLMKIKVKVYPNSSKERVKQELGVLKVYVSASPEKGKANKRVVDILSKYLKVKKSSLKIIRGLSSREKTVEIA